MDSAYTLDDVLQAADCLLKNTEELFQEFSDIIFETGENLYFNLLKELFKNQESQNALQEVMEKECSKLGTCKLILENNKVHYEELKDKVAKEKELKLVKESCLLKLEKDVKKINKNIQSSLDDKEKIDTQKDIILTYKLLTNTSFVYSTKKVSGIVLNNPPVSFSFNPEELSQEKISEKLWELVLKDKN